MNTRTPTQSMAAPTLDVTPLAANRAFARARTVRYVGSVTRVETERVLRQIEKLLDASPEEEITLFVTSTGGPTGTAMSFFDTIRTILQPRLTTIGSGDVDSSGILIFLSGDTRFVTPRTTLLFHPAGRVFGGDMRYTIREMESMLVEDRLKDEQYADVVAAASRGRLTRADVLDLMERHTVVSPQQLVEFGLADALLG